MLLLRHLFSRVMETANADGGAGGGGEGADGGGAGGGADQGTVDNGAAAAAEIESRARSMGWAPKDQWRGAPDNWIDAKEFVQRGEQVMPILRANLRQSENNVAMLQRQHNELQQQLRAANESIQVLTNLSTEASRNAAREKRRELLRQQQQASSNGDTDLVVDLGEQIADVTSQINAAQTAAEKPGKQTKQSAQQQQQAPADGPTNDPEYQAWVRENPWFGTDGRKTAMATAIGEEIRKDPANANLLGRAFFDKVTQEVNKFFATPRATTSKVEGSAGPANGGGGNNNAADPATGKTYNDLPAEAKAACERQANWVVGKDRAFKDKAAWQKHYVSMYFNS